MILRLWLLAALLLVPPTLRAQPADLGPAPAIIEPWEPAAAAPPAAVPSAQVRPVAEAALALISLYQREIGVHSMARCPFALSCSRYAHDRIDRLGVYGMLLFLDRYFYRETILARQTYPWAARADGTLGVDDGHLELE